MSHVPMDSFLEACGAAGPLLLDVEERDADENGVRRVFHRPFLLIGRHPDADLRLDHPQVSIRHAYVQMVGGRLACIDLGSRTGTSVGGVTGAVAWVDPLVPVRVGPFDLTFSGPAAAAGMPRATETPPSPLSLAYARQNPLPDVRLEISGDGLRPAVWAMKRSLVLVGRSPLCKLKVSYPGASSFYGSLVRTQAGIWWVALLSSEGVLVNGSRRRYALLRDGDELTLERYRMRVRYDAPDRLAAVPEERPVAGKLALVEPAKPLSPASLAELHGAPPAMLALLAEVGQMHQQMYDQFHQAMGMMARMFGAMHRDHMNSVRDELEQIRRLTEEIHALRTEVTETASTTVPDTASVPNDLFRHQRTAPETPGPMPKTNGHAVPSPEEPAVPPPRSRTVPDLLQIHAMASERLAAYEKERQSRWKSLLRLMNLSEAP